jgi:hypothetical protein
MIIRLLCGGAAGQQGDGGAAVQQGDRQRLRVAQAIGRRRCRPWPYADDFMPNVPLSGPVIDRSLVGTLRA